MLTAAFGGASKAPTPPLPLIAVGQPYTNDEVSIAVHRLVVTDSFDEYLAPGPDDKLVVLVLTVTNRWDRPLGIWRDLNGALSLSTGSVSDLAGGGPPMGDGAVDAEPGRAVLLGALDAPTYTRTDDLTSARTLQPGLPVPLAWIWNVDAATALQIANGEEVTVTIYDQTLITGTYTYAGTGWGAPAAAAQVVLRPESWETVALASLNVPTSQGALPPDSEPGRSDPSPAPEVGR